jgi:hypothetical protein
MSMPHDLTRRAFLQAALGTAAASGATLAAAFQDGNPAANGTLPATMPPLGLAAEGDAYSVLFLGDVHYDRLSHHDMSWLTREKPNDVSQVQNYSRLTADVWPQTLARLRAHIAEERAAVRPAATIAAPGGGDDTARAQIAGRAGRGGARVGFVAQIGDIIEGLCGTSALAELQAREALASISDARLGAPFLFCKGNHDITGPGAREVFDRVLQSFVRRQAEAIGAGATCFDTDRACLALSYGPDWFLFADAYEPAHTLAWLQRVLAKRTARHVFLLVHPPLVPYGARSTWILYAKPEQHPDRQRLLDLLGEHRVFVLTGHIHRYAAVARQTARGPFVQLALSSVISDPALRAPAVLDASGQPLGASATSDSTSSSSSASMSLDAFGPTSFLSGVERYVPEQIRVEPHFSPATETERRAVLAEEAPAIRGFEYGDVPGYASITIEGARGVHATLHAGLAARPWRTLDLIAWREAAAARPRRE